MNVTDDRWQHRSRTVLVMRRLSYLLRDLGAAGAAANARAELASAHVRNLQAAVVAKQVLQRSGGHGVPLTPAAEPRVA